MAKQPENNQLQFMPDLQLYYDPVRRIYFPPEGISDNAQRRRRTDEEPLDNIKFNVNALIKIIVVVAAAVLQYAVLVNKIDDSAEKLLTAKTNTEQLEKRIKDLETTIGKVESQTTITSELINQLQIRMSNDRKK